MTKQNFFQRQGRERIRRHEHMHLKRIIETVREDHPEMGGKELYRRINPPTIGRDRFLECYSSWGFRVVPKRNWRCTTDSSGVIRFPNLIEGRELTGINQAWVSDITYYEMGDKFSYITLVMDMYSRKIVGYSASTTLHVDVTTIPAIKMALGRLKDGSKPIIHSDGGGQYFAKEFLKLTRNKLINSMGVSCYENSHAERLNKTIKNQYLYHFNPSNEEELSYQLRRTVRLYNNEKPHQALNGLTPAMFELKKLSTK